MSAAASSSAPRQSTPLQQQPTSAAPPLTAEDFHRLDAELQKPINAMKAKSINKLPAKERNEKRAELAMALRMRVLSTAAVATSASAKRSTPSAFVEVHSKKAKASSSSSSSSGVPPADDGMEVESAPSTVTITNNTTTSAPIDARPTFIRTRTPTGTPSPAPAPPVDEAVAEAHAYVTRLMSSVERNKIERTHGAEMLKAKREQIALQRQLATMEAENKRLRSSVATNSSGVQQQVQAPDAQQSSSELPAADGDAADGDGVAGDADAQHGDSVSTTDHVDNDWTADTSDSPSDPSGDSSSSSSNSDNSDSDEDRRDRKRRKRSSDKKARRRRAKSDRERRLTKDAMEVWTKLKGVLPAWEKPTAEKPSLLPWLRKLESHLESVAGLLPRRQWYRIIMNTVPENTLLVDRQEIAKLVASKPDWDNLVEALTLHFDRIDHVEQLRTKFANIRQGNRTVSEYNNTFRSMMEELGFDITTSTHNENYLKGLDRAVRDEFNKQRDAMRHADELQHGRTSRSTIDPMLEHVMVVCERISFRREDQDRHKHNGGSSGSNGGGDKSKQSHDNSSNGTKTKGDQRRHGDKPLKRKRGNDKKQCKVHGWCGHSTKDCRSLNRNNMGAARGDNKNDRPPVKCHICQGPHYANKCDKRGNRDQRQQHVGANNSDAGANGSQSNASSSTGSGASPWVSKQQYKAHVKQMKSLMKELKELKVNKKH